MNQVSVPCRAILESDPASGAWNMAVDEALLESALAQGMFAVRLYRWDGATLSLGYFQKPEEATGDPRLAGLPRVRRLSGGGAILHHHEWTYSCVLPPGHPIAAVPHLLYETVHRAIVDVLRKRGVTAALRRDFRASDPAGPTQSAEGEAFLCFARGDARDIVCAGHKITGSAQRRRRGAVLQHGSILFRRSEFAPEFPGIADLVPGADLSGRLAEELLERIAAAIVAPAVDGNQWGEGANGEVIRAPLSEEVRQRAAELQSHCRIV